MATPTADLRGAIARRNQITAEVAREISKLLERRTAELIVALDGVRDAAEARRRASAMLFVLYQDLVNAIRRGVHLTARDVEERYLELTERLLRDARVGLTVFDAGPVVQAATRILRGTRRFASVEQILAGHLGRARELMFSELTQGALDGLGGRAIAERMRQALLGQAGPEIEAESARRIAEGRRPVNLRYLTERVAISSINAAHHEAHREAAIRSPVVKALRWRTNSWRGETTYDICDELALQDLYGLGPGVYPVGKTPDKPHPFCKCVVAPILFDPDRGERYGYDKPNPGLRVDPQTVRLHAPDKASPALIARIRRELAEAARFDVRSQ